MRSKLDKRDMINHQNPPIDRLIVFGRYPVPGRTKTRLIPALGPAGAADLQRWLTEGIMETAEAFALGRGVNVEFCFEGGSVQKIRRWLGPDISLSRQRQGDLGTRMYDAFLAAFQKGCRRAVLIGTDIPDLRTDHLRQAFDALSENDLVIGPSIDGGYWLIGLNHPARLFEGIKWGTRAVLAQTLALANGQCLRVKELDYLTDIDTAEGLRERLPDWPEKGPYVSVIIPALNEALNIEKTIRKARNNDAEVIVVDGGSDDDTVVQATRAGARIEKSSRGRAVQQNRGASVARGRTLLFLHADTHLPRGYINHVFEALMNPETVAGAFRFKTDLDHPLMKPIELATNIRSRYLKLPYGDQGLFFRKAIFEGVGGFPEVPIAEDLFLMHRISKQGRIKIAPVHAITSGRRWQTQGFLRTTLINQFIVAGCFLGISPRVLARLYRVPEI
ncbi:MAG: TIGR04283 family arsenosugar biosynthesis glycosyltransferase [Desulfobacteraceae bacterium]|nr:TIGR04283 family arsenosugar biosynthesis glycosyltransferase [Desulfobacteraceae bacterium]